MTAFTPQAARIPPRPSKPFVVKGFSLLSALFLCAILGFVEFRLHRILHHAFSAGGHLAACFGTETLGYAHYGLPAPATLMLCYPVITMGAKTHEGSRQNLLGGKAANAGMQEQYSIECQVTAQYPPSYIWQFDSDDTVPIENSRLLTKSLQCHPLIKNDTIRRT